MGENISGDVSNPFPRNIAVIGSGYWGRNLVRNFAELGALHTICDSNRESLARLDEQYHSINKETSFENVLRNQEISGVVISAPAVLHHSMSKAALEAGKDVFVEKPLALTVVVGEQLVRLAEKHDRILMVGHLLEYHPAVVKLKQLVDSGQLGKINYIYSSRLNLGKIRTEENILWSFAPHDISVILLLLGEMPQQVSAHGGQYLTQGVVDVTVTTMSFRDNAKAHIFVSWLHPYKEQRLVVIGDRIMAVFDDVEPDNKLVLYENYIGWQNRIPVPDKKRGVAVDFKMDEPLKLECRHFIESIISRKQPRTHGSKGVQVLQILNACEKSLKEHGVPASLTAADYFIHPSSEVESPVRIGKGTSIWHFSHIMPEVEIGANCNIGQNVFIASNVKVGNNVKIQNNVSLYEGVILEDDVFCGPSCVFTNVKVPRSHRPQRGSYNRTLVKKGATIGANATIVCGSTIGQYSFIGAGSVVTRDVPDHALVYGNPATIQGWACECGTRLDIPGEGEVRCPVCGNSYLWIETEGEVTIARDK